MPNLILDTDSYKVSHWLQYPPGTTRVSSYIEPRKSPMDEIVFFGLQAHLLGHLAQPVLYADVVEARDLLEAHGEPFNVDGWMAIVNDHNGRLPVVIEALPEGTVHGAGVPQVQITNTDPRFGWLPGYLETALLRAVWYPSTVATLSRYVKSIIKAGLDATSDDPEGQLPFKLHDFGARGATSPESAALGGMGHLVNFMGTDTLGAVQAARRFYGAPMAGYSIPAAEHSTITSWGRPHEVDAYRNMLDKFPTGTVAVVSDSYDLFNAVDNLWGDELKDRVLNRDGLLVIRPDSGDPILTPLAVIESLMKVFGGYTNSKGYRVLNDKVRVIQGDGIEPETIQTIVESCIMRRLSLDNIAFGMGGGLLQKLDRDTLGYAMKASAIERTGGWFDVYKDPVTDHGKRSKRGRQAVINRDGVLTAVRLDELPDPRANKLKEVFRNGHLVSRTTLTEVRTRAAL